MTAQKYRKKPVEIEAMQWDGTPEGATPIINWVLENGGAARWDEPHDEIRHELPDGTVQGCPASPGGLFIDTIEGIMRADTGWWVIRGVEGEFYPCKPSVFAESYDDPDEALTPAQSHYAAAEYALDLSKDEADPTALIAQAQVHATLAQAASNEALLQFISAHVTNTVVDGLKKYLLGGTRDMRGGAQ